MVIMEVVYRLCEAFFFGGYRELEESWCFFCPGFCSISEHGYWTAFFIRFILLKLAQLHMWIEYRIASLHKFTNKLTSSDVIQMYI